MTVSPQLELVSEGDVVRSKGGDRTIIDNLGTGGERCIQKDVARERELAALPIGGAEAVAPGRA